MRMRLFPKVNSSLDANDFYALTMPPFNFGLLVDRLSSLLCTLFVTTKLNSDLLLGTRLEDTMLATSNLNMGFNSESRFASSWLVDGNLNCIVTIFTTLPSTLAYTFFAATKLDCNLLLGSKLEDTMLCTAKLNQGFNMESRFAHDMLIVGNLNSGIEVSYER